MRTLGFIPRSKLVTGLAFPKFILWAVLLALISSSTVSAKHSLKTDRFRGSVVVIGPKAITVKSEQNTYLVRTFNYTPQLERKIQSKKPSLGVKVTVHYLRGTDIAVKVN
ncbi:MAG: hypothetical protein DMG06_16550 [Acidobacteria bacterium]|nr:MAG: hypothetical protein DMG06_16550 [Acidobacteriota bacterium]